MLKPWPKLTDRREWIYNSIVVGFICLMGGAAGKGLMWWIAWIMLFANGALYLVTLYCDYLEEKLKRDSL